MKLWKDVFNREIEEGDYILSGAKTGVLKLGTAYYSEMGNLMVRVNQFFSEGEESSYHKKYGSATSAVGVNVLILQKHDGTVAYNIRPA